MVREACASVGVRERGCARAGMAPASDTSSGGPGDDGKASNVPDPRSGAGQPWCMAISDLRVCGTRRFAELRELRSHATRGERTSPGRKSLPGRRGLAARTSVLSSPLRASPCSEGGAPTTTRRRVLGARGLHGRREPRLRALRPAPAHTPWAPDGWAQARLPGGGADECSAAKQRTLLPDSGRFVSFNFNFPQSGHGACVD